MAGHREGSRKATTSHHDPPSVNGDSKPDAHVIVPAAPLVGRAPLTMLNSRTLLLHLRSQWFSLAMVALGVLAWAWPDLGPALNPRNGTKHLIIAAVFLSQGLGLRTEEVRRGFSQWRLHLFIQLFSFALLPLACWLALLPWRATLPEGLVIGFYLLAVLPTTITSCVVFTQLAGGNTAAALFNAIAGNLAGIVLSPALLLLLIGQSAPVRPLEILIQLSLLVALPFAVGQALHWLLHARVAGWRRRLSLFNSFSILAVLYFVFSESFRSGTLQSIGADSIVPLALLIPAHLAILGLSWGGGRLLRFERRDLIAILFCAPQKTLALGIPLITASLAARPDLLGPATLPLLVYHPFQLFIAGLLKDWVGADRAPHA